MLNTTFLQGNYIPEAIGTSGKRIRKENQGTIPATR